MLSQVRVAQQQFALHHILFTFFQLLLPFWANQNNWRAVSFDQCSPSQLRADIAVSLVLFHVVSIHWKWRQATCVLFLSPFSVWYCFDSGHCKSSWTRLCTRRTAISESSRAEQQAKQDEESGSNIWHVRKTRTDCTWKFVHYLPHSHFRIGTR